MGSLITFEKLRTISTNAKFLLGQSLVPDEAYDDDDADQPPPQLRMINILPKSLETMVLNHCDVGNLDQAIELIKQKDVSVPHLESLTLNYHDSRGDSWGRRQRGETNIYPGYEEGLAERLRTDCEAKGVELIIGFSPI